MAVTYLAWWKVKSQRRVFHLLPWAHAQILGLCNLIPLAVCFRKPSETQRNRWVPLHKEAWSTELGPYLQETSGGGNCLSSCSPPWAARTRKESTCCATDCSLLIKPGYTARLASPATPVGVGTSQSPQNVSGSEEEPSLLAYEQVPGCTLPLAGCQGSETLGHDRPAMGRRLVLHQQVEESLLLTWRWATLEDHERETDFHTWNHGNYGVYFLHS